ncbi:hypothetical protein FJP68_14780 [Pantoea vagans]|nr:hypothetical protein FJP68_14780 [Pantoea vagans]
MIISSVYLSGLWGSKDYSFDFFADFNFIIGPNGSGKTTLLTLINSIFSMDIDSINKIDFFQCDIDLQDDDGENYKLSVFKGEDYSGESIINFVVDHDGVSICSDIINCRRLEKDGLEPLRTRRVSSKYNISDELRVFINQKINLTWLPIGRSSYLSIDRDVSVSSSVDIRLNSVAERFIKYMSYINQTIAERVNNFQKDIFMSSIDYSFVERIKHSETVLDSRREKGLLIEAFKEVGIEETLYEDKITKMFSIIGEIEKKQRSRKERRQLSFDEIIWIFNAWKSHFLVEKFNEYKEEKNNIRHDAESFVEVLNSLFEGRKAFFISKLNELCAYSNDGYEIKLNDLSSGEKQLIIILGEALLQQGGRCIYMADEPELSLHVSWQEKLVDSIIKINKNAQIIFATHSPDVVAWRGEYVIFMDES